MDGVLKKLEARIEEMVSAFAAAKKSEDDLRGRVAELEKQVGELEAQLEDGTESAARVEELERRNSDLASRLERVVAMIDGALEKTQS